MFLRKGAPVLLAAALGGCAATPPAAAPTLAIDGLWRIDQAMTEPLLDRRQARLEFGAGGRFVGQASCNRMSASWKLDGDRLELGPVVTTRMACGELQMEQEDRVLTALGKAVSAKVRPDGLLELRDAYGRGVLRGTRFAAPE